MAKEQTIVIPATYRGFTITYWASPVPNGPLWWWEHPDYDGAPDSGDDRCGRGRTILECEEQIDEMLYNEGASMQGGES